MKVAIWGRGRVATACARHCLNKDIRYQLVGREEQPEADVNVVIDFSHPSAQREILDFCITKNLPLIMGATGQNEAQIEDIKKASKLVPIVYESNFSLGFYALVSACQTCEKLLPNWDKSVVEIHRKDKKDAPSGSAKRLQKVLNCVVSSLRQGENFGEHIVYFENKNQQITLIHRAKDVDIFTEGAIFCAEKVVNLPPRLYCLADFLQ